MSFVLSHRGHAVQGPIMGHDTSVCAQPSLVAIVMNTIASYAQAVLKCKACKVRLPG